MPINCVRADITRMAVDAIVNSANPALIAGGGVCGAIHKAAGPDLERACRQIGRCAVGEAVITPAFGLPSSYVIHAVGPRWFDGSRGEPDLLQRCYDSIFALVTKRGISRVALPSISTGIYHYPLNEAVDIAVQAARRFNNNDLLIVFSCFDDRTLAAYAKHLEV